MAGERVRELIAAAGTSEEDLIGDLRKLRQRRRMKKT